MPAYEDDEEGRPADVIEIARRHYERGRYREAIRELRAAIARSASDDPPAAAHAVLGLCLRRAGEEREAGRELVRALSLAPRDPFVNFIAGHVCLECGDPARAEEHFLTSLDVAPKDDDYLRMLAVCHSFRGRYADALEVARRGLEINPGSAGLWKVAGICEHGLGMREESRRSLLTAVRLDDTEAEAHHALGLQSLEADRLDEAADWFRRALKANPGLSASRRGLVWTRFSQIVREESERAEGAWPAILTAGIVGVVLVFAVLIAAEALAGRSILGGLAGLGAIAAAVVGYYGSRFLIARRRAARELGSPETKKPDPGA
ncbi:MAG TPA: tetratricopeptide repeat protein [Planctomycetota bacterium]|nr:tetratricopeptide repeat protein [Planctomycetota bacterium]